MAWVKVYEAVIGPKLRTLANDIGCSQNEALGILVRLWVWGIRNVNAAGDHDDAHAAGQDDQRRVLVEDVEEGLGLPEPGAKHHHRQRVHKDEHHDGDGQQQIGICHIFCFLEKSCFLLF